MGLDGTSVSVNPVETIQLRNPASDSIEATQLQKIQQAIRASQNGPDAAKTEVGGKLAGRNGPAQASHHDPETFPAKFYNKYGPLFNQTFKGVLAEDAKSVSDQTLNNAPALDVKQSVQQLARKAQKPGDRVVGLSDPKYGRFGKIYIAKGHFYRGSDEDVFGTYAHELANNVAARMIGNALKHGDAAPSGIYKEHWDNDVGAAVERRMFSGHEQGW